MLLAKPGWMRWSWNQTSSSIGIIALSGWIALHCTTCKCMVTLRSIMVVFGFAHQEQVFILTRTTKPSSTMSWRASTLSSAWRGARCLTFNTRLVSRVNMTCNFLMLHTHLRLSSKIHSHSLAAIKLNPISPSFSPKTKIQGIQIQV